MLYYDIQKNKYLNIWLYIQRNKREKEWEERRKKREKTD